MAMATLLTRAAGGSSLRSFSARHSGCINCELRRWERLVESSSTFAPPSGSNDSSFFVSLLSRKQSFWKIQQQNRSIATSPNSPVSCCLQPTATPAFVPVQNSDPKFVSVQNCNPKLLLDVFAELQLRDIQDLVGGVRVRQHVNPLKAFLMAPLAPVKWKAVFADCSLPLMVDIGCGSGRFLMVLAKRSSGMQNFLGLDVRDKLVDRAKLWAEELNLSGNVHFVTANATVKFNSLLATYPGPLTFVSILCPDPHFKRRHQKRKMVQKQLVDAVVHRLEPGGRIFLQSDVKDVALEMRAQFDEHIGKSLMVAAGDGCDDLVKRDSEGWAEENPLGVPSEREAQVLAFGGQVYRVVYRRI